ncbi:MAG: hypothetical protein CBC24_09200 [Candidatus Pelagibacter sp. TMED64]|nr:MAG: hypothetical protein CBC24_09200 [Candidatus Pelagibacter sp. TMED64]|tara:strand:+ start:555 stop:776 length:222 start_codon:yes stop_codon:yes gene_type:complete
MPETSDGKKFDYTKLGMMKAKMHQKRLDKNKKKMGMGKKILASMFQLLHEAGNPSTRKYRQEKGIPLWGSKSK